jgi:hypothetical protein
LLGHAMKFGVNLIEQSLLGIRLAAFSSCKKLRHVAHWRQPLAEYCRRAKLEEAWDAREIVRTYKEAAFRFTAQGGAICSRKSAALVVEIGA